jgi:hypothetical protein
MAATTQQAALSKQLEEVCSQLNNISLKDAATDHGFTLLLTDEEVACERKLLKEHALGEKLSHTEAYKAIHRDSLDIVYLKEEDGVTRTYQPVKMKSEHSAIVGEFLIPCHDNKSGRIYINFTGTHNGATLHADLEHCPGEKTFQKNKHKIMSQLNDLIGQVRKQQGKDLALHISGHSLGGAYAQQMLNEIMRYQALNLKDKLEKLETAPSLVEKIITEDKKVTEYLKAQYGIKSKEIPAIARNQFDQVQALKLYTWNSAGVSKQIERQANKNAKILHHQGINIAGRFGMVGGDGVQRTGEGTVLSHAPVDVTLLKIDRGFEGLKNKLIQSLICGAIGLTAGFMFGPVGAFLGAAVGLLMPTYRAHTSKHFDESVDKAAPLQYELFRNNTFEGQAKIESKLKNKATFLQNPIVQGGMYALHKLGSLFSKVKKQFQQPTTDKKPQVHIPLPPTLIYSREANLRRSSSGQVATHVANIEQRAANQESLPGQAFKRVFSLTA